MDGVGLARVLGWILVTLGLGSIAVAPFGVTALRCRLPPLPLIPSPKGNNWNPVQSSPPPPICNDTEPVILAQAYLTIDTLFGNSPAGNAPGQPAQLHLRLPQKYYKAEAVGTKQFFREQTVSLDNVLYANSIGIKLAFLFGLAAWIFSSINLLSVRQVLCYTNPRVLLVEKLLLVLAITANIAAAILASVWGAFLHLSEHQLGDLRSPVCIGWLLGGFVLAFAAFIQTLDLTLTMAIKPKEEPPEPEEPDDPKNPRDPKDKKRRKKKKSGLQWQSVREPPSGYDSDFYSRYDKKSKKTAKTGTVIGDKSQSVIDPSSRKSVMSKVGVTVPDATVAPDTTAAVTVPNTGGKAKAPTVNRKQDDAAVDKSNQVSLATDMDDHTKKTAA